MNAFVRIALSVAAFAMAAPLAAQSWPQRPVKLILPLGPGAGADIGARLFADGLSKRWGQPVVVENRPGGDGVIALNAVIAAKDDHTLLWGPSSAFAGYPYTLDKLPYDKDELVPTARVTVTVVAIAVPASSKASTLKEFVALARENAGQFNWTSITQITDITTAGFIKKNGLQMERIGYKDTVSALNDLVVGRIQFYTAAYAIVRTQAQAGRIKLIAVTNKNRVAGLDLPTATESGFPELEFDGLVGIWGTRSSGFSDAARDRIAADVKAVAADPTVAQRLSATAQVINPGTGADLSASMEEQAATLARVASMVGIKPKF
ncbi:MAG TPA: tripartite tricarboxylate transporter substrate binding protein [Burkholderiales bacterium]|nr:tripartite tricarboxylate transporter substrate binding protein [Burkholderiales bacterium]